MREHGEGGIMSEQLARYTVQPLTNLIGVEGKEIHCRTCGALLAYQYDLPTGARLVVGGFLVTAIDGRCSQCDTPYGWRQARHKVEEG